MSDLVLSEPDTLELIQCLMFDNPTHESEALVTHLLAFADFAGIPHDEVETYLNHALTLDPVVTENMRELHKRSQVGIKKYGTTLENNKLTVQQTIQHAKEEALDLANYLEKLKRNIDTLEPMMRHLNVTTRK